MPTPDRRVAYALDKVRDWERYHRSLGEHSYADGLVEIQRILTGTRDHDVELWEELANAHGDDERPLGSKRAYL